MRKFLRWWRVAAAILLTLGLYPVFAMLPPLVACTDPAAQSLVLALCAGMGFYLLLTRPDGFSTPSSQNDKGVGKTRQVWVWVVAVSTLLLTLWLGVYPISPLRRDVLQGFTVITRTRGSVRVADGAVVTLAAGQPTALEPLTAFVDVHCNWMSAQGGEFDDPQSCDTVYIPPHSAYAILKVSIQPACGLPRHIGQIKISILP